MSNASQHSTADEKAPPGLTPGGALRYAVCIGWSCHLVSCPGLFRQSQGLCLLPAFYLVLVAFVKSICMRSTQDWHSKGMLRSQLDIPQKMWYVRRT